MGGQLSVSRNTRTRTSQGLRVTWQCHAHQPVATAVTLGLALSSWWAVAGQLVQHLSPPLWPPSRAPGPAAWWVPSRRSKCRGWGTANSALTLFLQPELRAEGCMSGTCRDPESLGFPRRQSAEGEREGCYTVRPQAQAAQPRRLRMPGTTAEGATGAGPAAVNRQRSLGLHLS